MKKTLLDGFKKIYNQEPERFFSCGGRFEILGNHTDHNHGKCMAGTCSLANYVALKVRNDNLVKVYSEGYGSFEADLNTLELIESEKGKSESLIRGIAFYLTQRGYKIGGLDVYMNSQVPGGAGVSSSAAFELLFAEIFNKLFNNDKIDRLLLCKAGQFAERNYYGKMCGLLDQIGVGFGGSTYMDFADIDNPKVDALPIKLDGYHFLIINSGGSHAGLDHLYKAIPDDMFSVAKFFKENYLNDVDEKDVIAHKDEIIETCGERAYGRAMHFYAESNRVERAREAIKTNNIDELINLMNQSCDSSTNQLQNMKVDKTENSPLEACELVRKASNGKAGVKINGGGFAGSVISLIKDEVYSDVINAATKRYGSKNVFEISIRPIGPEEL